MQLMKLGERKAELGPLNDVWTDALDCCIIETWQQKNMPPSSTPSHTQSATHPLVSKPNTDHNFKRKCCSTGGEMYDSSVFCQSRRCQRNLWKGEKVMHLHFDLRWCCPFMISFFANAELLSDSARERGSTASMDGMAKWQRKSNYACVRGVKGEREKQGLIMRGVRDPL